MADRNGNLIELGFGAQLRSGAKLRQQGAVVANLGIRGLQRHPVARDIPSSPIAGVRTANASAKTPATHTANCITQTGDLWFDAIHIFPRSIDFGQILTTTTVSLEIVNRYTNEDRTFSAFTNPIGGLSITNLPALPDIILRMDSLTMTLEATTQGPAVFNDNLQFVTDAYTLLLPVQGLRVTMFPYIPESPLIERLGFLTDVLTKTDGNEQRINLRKAPRQIFDLTYLREEITERPQMENLLMDWQDKVFGIPVWYEPTKLRSAATASDLTIDVDSTSFADYRVGGLVGIIQDDTTFDSLEITAITEHSITLASGLINSYPVGTKVYPLRTCYADETITGQRWSVNLAEYSIRMNVENNNVDLRDASAFSTYNSKVLLDGMNFMPDDTVESTYRRKMVNHDSRTGKFRRTSRWDISRRGSVKGFLIASREELWNVRRLIHSLSGRQKSFYLPTFQHEFTLTEDLVDSGTGMTVNNVNYTRFIRNRKPQNIIRLTKTDGTVLIRTIVSSTETSSTIESLGVDVAWPSPGIPKEDISRIDYYELVRLQSDNVRIEHLSGVGDARVVLPVVTVLD